MYPWLRLVKGLLTSWRRPPLGALDESVVRFRVWPTDLDNNLHLNNGRYLTVMDLGRWDLVTRSGLMRVALRETWHPVVAAATIRYRRPLDAFQAYDLRTRLIAWDERSFYIEQRFERNGVVAAVGAIRGVFLGPDGRVPTQQMVDRIAPGTVSPPIPAWIVAWEKALDMQREAEAGEKGTVG